MSHSHNGGGGFAGGAMGGMVGIILLVVIAVVVLIGVFLWQPWATGDTRTDDPVPDVVPGEGTPGNGNGGTPSSWYYQQPGYELVA